MKRNAFWYSVVAAAAVVLVGALSVSQSADPKANKKPKVEGRKEGVKPKPAPRIRLIEMLRFPITLEKGIDANTPLKDALEYLGDHYDFTILIDTKAVNDALQESQKDAPEAEAFPVRLPKVTNVPLATVLRLLLGQLNVTYIIRKDYIEVTSLKKAAAKSLLQQRVTATFDSEALDKALEEISEMSGVSVVLDGRASDKSQSAVKATFKNDVSVETAVRLLADMAGLKSVRVGAALYVTTTENAALLQAEEEKALKKEKAKAKPKKVEKSKTDKAP